MQPSHFMQFLLMLGFQTFYKMIHTCTVTVCLFHFPRITICSQISLLGVPDTVTVDLLKAHLIIITIRDNTVSSFFVCNLTKTHTHSHCKSVSKPLLLMFFFSCENCTLLNRPVLVLQSWQLSLL